MSAVVGSRSMTQPMSMKADRDRTGRTAPRCSVELGSATCGVGGVEEHVPASVNETVRQHDRMNSSQMRCSTRTRQSRMRDRSLGYTHPTIASM